MKTLITAGILALTVAGAAQAQNMFAYMGDQDDGTSTVVIDPFSATGDGYVAVYDHHRGETGDLLGVASIRAGANNETRVQVGRPLRNDVIAYLFVGDNFTDPSMAVDSVEIDIKD
ncbi:MAG: hypothetical protein GVY31_10800 [Alphaproteobacteria bacterium]|jgi:hypothetical protein|nr:hypothetical protein [Alphaproteobacteria bacterium]